MILSTRQTARCAGMLRDPVPSPIHQPLWGPLEFLLEVIPLLLIHFPFTVDRNAGIVLCEHLVPTQSCMNILSGVLYADETGWRINGLLGCLWCFTTPSATLFAIERSRASPVVLKFITEQFAGVLVSDFWAAYNILVCAKQKCLVHLLRDLQRVERYKDTSRDWAEWHCRGLGWRRPSHAVPRGWCIILSPMEPLPLAGRLLLCFWPSLADGFHALLGLSGELKPGRALS
jgi:hypothetical protein